MIYQLQWNYKGVEKPKFDIPFLDDNTFNEGKHNFYQLKFETQSTPKQQDGHNCAFSLVLCIMPLYKALHGINISSSWIDQSSDIPRIIIPNCLFASISYNIMDDNHFQYVRMDFIKILDRLARIQNDAYKKQKSIVLEKSRLAFNILTGDDTYPFIRNQMSKFDYLNEEYSQTIAGMTEQQVLKNAFKNLDEMDHEFVDVFGDDNCVIYQLGNIPLYDRHIDGITGGKRLSKFVRQELFPYYNKLTEEERKKYFYPPSWDDQSNTTSQDLTVEEQSLIIDTR